MLTKKNSQATAILATICHKMEQNQFNSLMKEAYVNGREQGFSLVNQLMNGQPQVVFAEARTSDQIVVYCGNFGDFSMQGNTPSEKTYKNDKQYFDPYAFEAAADFIIRHLTVP